MRRWFAIGMGLLTIGTAVAGAERLTVSVPNANIRSGPGTQYEILWQVEKYHPLMITKKTGAWYLFQDFEGDTGWVHKSLVAKIPSAITAKSKANVRSGPGMSFKISFTVGKGIPFRILKQKDNWLQVEHADGDRGWIHKGLIW
ncbi:MAG: SH3 domain-containing protein [Desulfobacterales bacterium]